MRKSFVISAPSRRDGKIGGRAQVHVAEGRWEQPYHFDTHGLTSTETAAQVAEIEDYHARKAERLEEFTGTVQGQELTTDGGTTYRIVDCTIFDKHCALYVDVRKVEGENLTHVYGFPIRRAYNRVEDIPAVDAIMAMITDALPADDDLSELNAVYVDKVQAKLR